MRFFSFTLLGSMSSIPYCPFYSFQDYEITKLTLRAQFKRGYDGWSNAQSTQVLSRIWVSVSHGSA